MIWYLYFFNWAKFLNKAGLVRLMDLVDSGSASGQAVWLLRPYPLSKLCLSCAFKMEWVLPSHKEVDLLGFSPGLWLVFWMEQSFIVSTVGHLVPQTLPSKCLCSLVSVTARNTSTHFLNACLGVIPPQSWDPLGRDIALRLASLCFVGGEMLQGKTLALSFACFVLAYV